MLPNFSSDLERVEVLNTVLSNPLISFDFSSFFANPGSPSKTCSSTLKSTSLLNVLILKFLADYFTVDDSNCSYLVSNLGADDMQVVGISFGIPFLGFINS